MGGSGGSSIVSGSGGTADGGSAGAAGTSDGCPGAAGAGIGAAQGTVLFFDDFEEGAASNWIRSPNNVGDWSIVCDDSLVYRQNTQTDDFRVSVAGSVDWTDQVVEARVKVLSFATGSPSYLVGVYGRFKDLDNHYYVALRYDGRIGIRMKLNGSNTTLDGTAVDAGITTDTWYVVKLEIIGSTLNAYIDGALLATATESSIPSGGVAVGATNSTAEFDDVRVTAP